MRSAKITTHGYRGGEPFQLRKKNKKKQKERKKSFEHFT